MRSFVGPTHWYIVWFAAHSSSHLFQKRNTTTPHTFPPTGHGHALHVYAGQQPHLQHLKYYNLSRRQQQAPHLVSVSTLEMGPQQLAARQAHVAAAAAAAAGAAGGPVALEAGVEGEGGGVPVEGAEDAEADASARVARWAAEEAAAEAEEKAAAAASGSFNDEGTGAFSEARWGKYLEKRRPRRRQLRWGRHLLTTGADCLVAAFKHHDPAQAVLALLPFLREGATFAVFCEYLEVRVRVRCVWIVYRVWWDRGNGGSIILFLSSIYSSVS